MLNLPQLSAEPGSRYKYLVIALMTVSSPFLLAIHDLKWLGWILLLAAAVVAAFRATSRFGQHMLLLIGMLIFLGLVPINTDISYGHMFIMGSVLIATVILPYIVTRHYLKDRVITFPFRMARRWSKLEIGYILFAGLAAYLILPFYLANTSSYLNWEALLEPSHIIRLFIGTNALGIWDELFFVGVCFNELLSVCRGNQLRDRDGYRVSVFAGSSVRAGAPRMVSQTTGRQQSIRGESAQEVPGYFSNRLRNAMTGNLWEELKSVFTFWIDNAECEFPRR